MKHNAKFALLTGLFTGLLYFVFLTVADFSGLTLFHDQTISGYIATGIVGGLSVWFAQIIARKFL